MAQVQMSRSRSVLKLDSHDDVTVSFNNLNDDPMDSVPFSNKATIISHDQWEALGSPEIITVTVEPGNTLSE